jgi:hypothetical protein
VTIKFNFSTLKRTRWYEYALRFIFGGAVTMVAGLVANHYGPALGGLFLAFPAIFPASATLIEKHETEKKRRVGITDKTRGRRAAALDARGATLGCVALGCFGLALWWLLPRWNPALSLLAALVIWLAVSLALWSARRMRFAKRRV